MLAAYATCDDYPHNAYPGRFLNFKIYLLFGVDAGIMFFFYFFDNFVEKRVFNSIVENVGMWESLLLE